MRQVQHVSRHRLGRRDQPTPRETKLRYRSFIALTSHAPLYPPPGNLGVLHQPRSVSKRVCEVPGPSPGRWLRRKVASAELTRDGLAVGCLSTVRVLRRVADSQPRARFRAYRPYYRAYHLQKTSGENVRTVYDDSPKFQQEQQDRRLRSALLYWPLKQ